MNEIILYKTDAAKNVFRFYQFFVPKIIFRTGLVSHHPKNLC